ncbi:MAG: sulfate ABC transporter ATP-binding protein [Pegethrix bostrychoides GSE-TBD4-15B]|jgi:sulfate transport system ATP-binding protein|uniref:ABC-type quaternary amine transporter n=1 Tax=Pegethrix bostrychoides GSE-TBD4-15B TaxID=2839662 RepID=A0A951P8D2_9CYAN|nr:sulfate ABC transporter ATP-binding protein [Pegethrix bostrychoides GSE-TBD4-15B]
MGIRVDQVSKQFGAFQAVDRVSLEVETGALVALLGPSGSGKSTLLRLIAGLEQPDSGRIFLTGRDSTHESVQQRGIGFVFQHYALFKHLTVRQNISFGLEIAKQPKARVRNRVNELLELIQLESLGNRYPAQLSGGQRQRVALARALALEPQVLLLDEPFGALDAKVRKDLRAWLRRMHDTVYVTTVFVTHDQEEAMEVSDQVVVMNQGRVEQVGSPAALYDDPATPFVMSFIGTVNVLPSHAEILRRSGYQAKGREVFLRPNDVVIKLAPDAALDAASVPAAVKRVIHLGWEIQVELLLEDGQSVMAHLTREQFDQLNLQPLQSVYVELKAARSFAVVNDYQI